MAEKYCNVDLSSLSYQINNAVTDIAKELVLNLENQFLDDAFDRENVYNNASTSEYETEYEPDNSSVGPVNLFK